MKMIFHQKDKRKISIPFIISTIFFVIVAGLYFLTPVFFPSLLYSFAAPVWSVRSFVVENVAESAAYLKSKRSLEEENNRLETQNEIIKQSAIALEVLRKENIELRSVINREGVRPKTLGKITSRPPASPFDTVIIDVGTSSGVKEGDIAVVSGSMALGEVARVFENGSLIRLYSTPDTTVEVQVVRSGTNVQAIGKGGGNFELVVPKETDVIEGDLVSLGSTLFIAGEVDKVLSAESGSFKTALFRLPVNIRNVSWVEIYEK